MPKSSASKKKVTGGGVLVLAVVVGVLWVTRGASTDPKPSAEPPRSQRVQPRQPRGATPNPPTKQPPDALRSKANARLADLFERKQSGIWVSLNGTVVKMLPDDNDGSRHQRFILRVGKNQTVLVAHNIDLAPRVPVKTGAPVFVEGKYEWNELGGVVHFTHLPSLGGKRGGFIRFNAKRYQ